MWFCHLSVWNMRYYNKGCEINLECKEHMKRGWENLRDVWNQLSMKGKFWWIGDKVIPESELNCFPPSRVSMSITSATRHLPAPSETPHWPPLIRHVCSITTGETFTSWPLNFPTSYFPFFSIYIENRNPDFIFFRRNGYCSISY